MKTYLSLSSKETQAFGEALARQLVRGGDRAIVRKSAESKKRTATVIALAGDLGAGKTTFVQGFFWGLGLKRHAQSPTFIIMRRHKIPVAPRASRRVPPRFTNIFHIDAYRLKEAKQMEALDFHEILADAGNVILIEWPERIKNILPRETIWISFKHGSDENERNIIIKK